MDIELSVFEVDERERKYGLITFKYDIGDILFFRNIWQYDDDEYKFIWFGLIGLIPFYKKVFSVKEERTSSVTEYVFSASSVSNMKLSTLKSLIFWFIFEYRMLAYPMQTCRKYDNLPSTDRLQVMTDCCKNVFFEGSYWAYEFKF